MYIVATYGEGKTFHPIWPLAGPGSSIFDDFGRYIERVVKETKLFSPGSYKDRPLPELKTGDYYLLNLYSYSSDSKGLYRIYSVVRLPGQKKAEMIWFAVAENFYEGLIQGKKEAESKYSKILEEVTTKITETATLPH